MRVLQRRCGSTSPAANLCGSADPSPRDLHRMGQRRAREFLQPHRLAEQITLDQIETHLVRRDEIGTVLDALGDDPRAVSLAELDDATAYRPLQPVVGAAGDELPVDLEFSERETLEPHQ